jgi:hypothetical protein
MTYVITAQATELQKELEKVEREGIIDRFENANFTAEKNWSYDKDDLLNANFYCRLSTTLPQALTFINPRAIGPPRVRADWVASNSGGLGFRCEDREATHEGECLHKITRPLTLSQVAQALKNVFQKEQATGANGANGANGASGSTQDPPSDTSVSCVCCAP